jgi:hypothetical protein
MIGTVAHHALLSVALLSSSHVYALHGKLRASRAWQEILC